MLMRTTLNLRPDALASIRQLARQRQMSMGEVASDLIIQALRPTQIAALRNGVPVFPAQDGAAPDLKLVNRLRDAQD